MLNEAWKRRLIHIAHSGSGKEFNLKTRMEFPKTVLGQKINQSKTMTQTFPWLHKIKGKVLQDELLASHTSIQIGGPADVLIYPEDTRDIQTILKNRGKTPIYILGEGSNLLASDRGIRGIVISLKECFKEIKRPLFFKKEEGQRRAVIKVGAGAKMSYLAKHAARFSLTGIEQLVGIPGSLGGSVVMNAGAEGVEIGSVLRSVTRITRNGDIETLKREDLTFEYRKTIFPDEAGIIIEAEIELEEGDRSEIMATMDRHLSRRSQTQPLTIPNSGSIFKNPEGDAAGRIIESIGLKGYSIGKAGVSIRHANFIVNKGGASAKDVTQLIKHIQKEVKEKTNIDLQTEIVILGD
ncbi:MAG: UDP-N-acetylmuramate dehydrogenase [Nitrospina sp.]|jgi:UDP-N-acetylmuramate dehydrogenase|nr:UDP-N-acetylmuramate dehydrogenase [Nitrospina sp.]